MVLTLAPQFCTSYTSCRWKHFITARHGNGRFTNVGSASSRDRAALPHGVGPANSVGRGRRDRPDEHGKGWGRRGGKVGRGRGGRGRLPRSRSPLDRSGDERSPPAQEHSSSPDRESASGSSSGSSSDSSSTSGSSSDSSSSDSHSDSPASNSESQAKATGRGERTSEPEQSQVQESKDTSEQAIANSESEDDSDSGLTLRALIPPSVPSEAVRVLGVHQFRQWELATWWGARYGTSMDKVFPTASAFEEAGA